jgi:hypothetical protein
VQTLRLRARTEEVLLGSRFLAIIGGINQGSTPGLAFEGIDSTHVSATFSAAVLNDPSISLAGVWRLQLLDEFDVVVAEIDVLDAVPQQTPTTVVILTTSEHQEGGTYRGTLYNLTVA